MPRQSLTRAAIICRKPGSVRAWLHGSADNPRYDRRGALGSHDKRNRAKAPARFRAWMVPQHSRFRLYRPSCGHWHHRNLLHHRPPDLEVGTVANLSMPPNQPALASCGQSGFDHHRFFLRHGRYTVGSRRQGGQFEEVWQCGSNLRLRLISFFL